VFWLHNTAVGKWASKIFETNALRPVDFKVKQDIQPTVSVEPSLLSFSSTSTGTIYTAPLDKEFYLTNISLTCAGDGAGVGGVASIVFTGEELVQQTIECKSEDLGNGANSLSIAYPKRGILIKKGTAITVGITSLGCVNIAGYLSSDRG